MKPKFVKCKDCEAWDQTKYNSAGTSGLGFCHRRSAQLFTTVEHGDVRLHTGWPRPGKEQGCFEGIEKEIELSFLDDKQDAHKTIGGYIFTACKRCRYYVKTTICEKCAGFITNTGYPFNGEINLCSRYQNLMLWDCKDGKFKYSVFRLSQCVTHNTGAKPCDGYEETK